MTAILDASVAGKYLVPEADSDKAQALIRDWEQGKTELKAPQILPAEVASLLRKRVLRGLLPASVATELFFRFEALGVPLESINDLAAPALALALRYGHSVYDGLYVALAFRSGAELITADEKLCRALHASKVRVRPLRNWF